MRDYSIDGWASADWVELEMAASVALCAGRDLDDLIGSGGGSFGPQDLSDIVNALDITVKRLKSVQNNYISMSAKYGPDNPPRLRKPGESVSDYRAAMGWNNG